MIRIERHRPQLPAAQLLEAPAPRFFDEPRVRRERERAATFFASKERSALQRQHDFNWDLLAAPELTSALSNLFVERCAFCTRDPGRAGSLVPHHFRPPQDAVDVDGQTSRSHYWWLAYDWENLYLACEECHAAQGAKFPVDGERAPPGTTGEDLLEREAALLLDPCWDFPESELVYIETGEVVSASPRGLTTIETFEMNRPTLIEARLEELQRIEVEIATLTRTLESERSVGVLASLRALVDPAMPLAGLRRQYANQWVEVRPRKVEAALWEAAGDSISLDDLTGDLERVTNAMQSEVANAFFEQLSMLDRLTTRSEEDEEDYGPEPQVLPRAEDWSSLAAAEIREIEIRNFRAIKHLSLELTEGKVRGNWLMLLGENGVGKTSVLQAIALGLSSTETIERLPVDPRRFLNNDAEEGFIRLGLSGSRRGREIRFGREIEGFACEGEADGILVAGYGPTRLLPESVGAREASSKVASLFDPRVPLARPDEWIPDLTLPGFSAVARALKHLLDLDDEEELLMGEHGLTVVRGESQIPLIDLSDGYKAMAALGLDLMQFFLRRWGNLEAAEGIVLIDELGAHLHPRWQMKVTKSLREAFPRVQFVATTHDPLCLRGLQDGEVAVLRSEKRNTYALREDLPPVEGLAVDQLLTSEHFGLYSTLDPEMEDRLHRYYALLAARARSFKEEGELRELTATLEQRRVLGSTQRERLALTAADEFLAEGERATSTEEYMALKQETKERIRSIWRESLPR
jgi:energy-coupling factor transporter ATP-binding protein EcfA2